MDLLNFAIQNKEILKIFYAIIIIFICLVIVVKTHRLFHLSLHRGIRYFRNAFFFYGIGFFIRYILGAEFIYGFFDGIYYSTIEFLFEFFLVMGGFFLIYSLLWKKFEGKFNPFSSFFHFRIAVFYFMSLIVVLLDNIWETYYFMFFSQIIIFIIASIIAYNNYRKNVKPGKFLKFYFIAMVLSLIAWLLNALIALILDWNKIIQSGIYIINLAVFFLFLYGVIKFTKK